MIKLTIGGVPEHFNLPWHLALEARRFAPFDLDVRWRDFPDGSGAMAKALRGGQIDAALLLTEGAVAGIADGGGFRVASLYTETPLLWGIHVPAESSFRSVAEIRGARYAVSRRGSGSHLMAVVHARDQGWGIDDLEFVIVRNLAGAVDAFATRTADVFFWEKFMTKPLVDAGKFRRIGEFAAPWPAFVACVADSATADQRSGFAQALALVLDEARALRARPDGAAVIAKRYELLVADVVSWLATTRWSGDVGVVPRDLDAACAALDSLGVLTRSVTSRDCIAADPAER